MSKSSMVLRDLLASCIDGNTINVETSTATDLVRAVVSEATVEVPWYATGTTYGISGYTIASGTSGAMLYTYYVNTGATMVTLTTGDTTLTTYISGITSGTTVPTGVTIYNIYTYTSGTTTEVNNLLKVNLYGVSGITVVNGTSGTNGAAGTNGTSGTNGAAGTNGTSGSSGTNGVSGTNGTTGAAGTNGTSGITIQLSGGTGVTITGTGTVIDPYIIGLL